MLIYMSPWIWGGISSKAPLYMLNSEGPLINISCIEVKLR